MPEGCRHAEHARDTVITLIDSLHMASSNRPFVSTGHGYGLSVEETAEVLHLSTDTIKRDWRLAKLWLLRALEGDSVVRR